MVVYEDRLAEPELVRDALSVVLVHQRAVDHSEGVALATSIVGEHTEHSDKHVVATGHGAGLGLGTAPRAVRVRSGRLETAAKRSPDQVSSIAAILKSTSPFARPAVRTACSVTSGRTPEVLFGQQIQRAFLSARFAMSATRAASSVAERTNQSVTSVWPRAERRSPTPGGRSGIVNSKEAPTRATVEASRIPSLLASGVPE